MKRILLVDLGERELKKRQELRARQQVLETKDKTAATSGGLSSKDVDELARIKRHLARETTADPFYQLVAATHQQKDWRELRRNNAFVHYFGLIDSQRGNKQSELDPNEREIASICGLLQCDAFTDASRPNFVEKISAAQGEYRRHRKLFDKVYEQLSQRYEVSLKSQIDAGLIDPAIVGSLGRGDEEAAASGSNAPTGSAASASARGRRPVPRRSDTVYVLSARNVAAAVRRLVTEKVSENDAWLASRIQNAYDMDTGVVAGAPPSSMEISLPDLDESTDVEIVRENLHAVQAIYFSWMLEEMHLPQVVERIVELFRAGLLPLGRGRAGDYLFNYYKRAVDRITEGERRDLYMRIFGAPGGDPNGNQPNREFNDLWLRFVSAVSSFARQLTVNNLLRSNIPVAVSQEQVRKAGRDLAANLSLHGYGIAYFAATELQSMIREYLDKLNEPELKTAFGARDIWQVIDQVNANYLGGPRNTHRYRTQAHAGAVIIRWLANHHQRLGGRFGEVISLSALTNPQLRGSDRPTVEPNDWDLVQACEQWLAVGGIQDDRVEQFAQPVESPVITSKPIQMPSFAREALDSLTGDLGDTLSGVMPSL